MHNNRINLRGHVFLLIGLAMFLAVTVVCFSASTAAGYVSAVCTLIYSAFVVYSVFIKKSSRFGDLESGGLYEIFPEILENVDSPVMVVNEHNRIVIGNPQFDSLGEVKRNRKSAGAGQLF
ncbi:MAG: hypothetical protein J5793_02150, partial [Clostridia bacterium]|nr:hypothetical protein [Clostridia bacterium]